MGKHTEGFVRLYVHPDNELMYIESYTGLLIARMIDTGTVGEAEENCKRLRDCWNALDGISTEAIEAGVVKDALNELKALEDVLSEMGEDILNPYHLGEIRAILKKAEGRT